MSNLLDMAVNDFISIYPNKTLITLNINSIGYNSIIETIINEYKKNPFNIDIENISNVANTDIKTNNKLWDDLIAIENLIFKKIYEYFTNLSIDTIKSFIFMYYNDLFDCLKDYINNKYEINFKEVDKKTFYLKLITFTIYFNTNIFNDTYYKIKEFLENNKLIII
jgi:hypothetical protein